MEISNITNDTNSSGLMTLVTQIHAYPKTMLKYSQGNNVREVEYNGVHEICDVLKITHLVFYSHVHLEEFKNLIKDSTFEIKLNNDDFLQIPLKFLMYMNDIVCSNNNTNNSIQKYYIKFPDFLFELVSVAVITKNFKITCNVSHDQIKCSLLVSLTFFDSPIRKRLAFNKFSKLGQSFGSPNEIIFDKNTRTKTFKIVYDRYSKGYFVYGKTIADIKCLKLTENGHCIIKYDKDLIQLFCKKINDNVVYIPYNFEKKYYHMTLDSFIGSMNEDKIDTTQITIAFDNNVNVDDDVDCNVLSIGLEYLNYERLHANVNNTRYPLYPVTSNYCFEKHFVDPPEDHLLNTIFS